MARKALTRNDTYVVLINFVARARKISIKSLTEVLYIVEHFPKRVGNKCCRRWLKPSSRANMGFQSALVLSFFIYTSSLFFPFTQPANFCSKNNNFLAYFLRQSYFTKTKKRTKNEIPIASGWLTLKRSPRHWCAHRTPRTQNIYVFVANSFPKIVSFCSIHFAFLRVTLFLFVRLLLFVLFLFFRCLSILRSTYKSKSYWIFKTFILRIVIYLCQLCFCQIIVSHLFSERSFLVGWFADGLFLCRFMMWEQKTTGGCEW